MWIKVIVWFKKDDESMAQLERLGIDPPKDSVKKYDPDQEGHLLVNSDKIIRINPSSDNKEYSVLWFCEEPPITIHVKHSLDYLQDVLRQEKYFDLT